MGFDREQNGRRFEEKKKKKEKKRQINTCEQVSTDLFSELTSFLWRV